MRIKTVWNNVDHSTEFDDAVNGLLADGWRLVKREVLPGEGYNATSYARRLLYAELVKLDEADMEPQEADPVTWQEAVDVLRETCREAKDCGTACPMYRWCKDNLQEPAPAHWSD